MYLLMHRLAHSWSTNPAALAAKVGTLSIDKQLKLEQDVKKAEAKAEAKAEVAEKKKKSSKVRTRARSRSSTSMR